MESSAPFLQARGGTGLYMRVQSIWSSLPSGQPNPFPTSRDRDHHNEASKFISIVTSRLTVLRHWVSVRNTPATSGLRYTVYGIGRRWPDMRGKLREGSQGQAMPLCSCIQIARAKSVKVGCRTCCGIGNELQLGMKMQLNDTYG